MRAFVAQTRTELTLSLRNGRAAARQHRHPAAAAGVLLAGRRAARSPTGSTDGVDFLTPGILALAVMSTAMVSLGIGTGFERQYKVLKRLGSTPLGRPRWIAAKIAMVLGLLVIQVVVIVLAALRARLGPGRHAGAGADRPAARHRRLRRASAC